MVTKIQRWGNSQGLRLKKDMLDALDIMIGDPLKVFIRSGNIIISPDKKRREKVDLKKLLSKTKQNHMKEVDWGMSAGKEVW